MDRAWLGFVLAMASRGGDALPDRRPLRRTQGKALAAARQRGLLASGGGGGELAGIADGGQWHRRASEHQNGSSPVSITWATRAAALRARIKGAIGLGMPCSAVFDINPPAPMTTAPPSLPALCRA